MTNADSPYLALLKDRLNLEKDPFTERGSRLLVFRSDHHLTIRLAERWFKSEDDPMAHRIRQPLIDEWRFTDGEGHPLDITLTTHPHRVDCQTAVGTFTLTFVDAETVLVALPSTTCGVTFLANLDNVQVDRRGGVLRLTGAVRRNVAYTTNAHVLRNEAENTQSATHMV